MGHLCAGVTWIWKQRPRQLQRCCPPAEPIDTRYLGKKKKEKKNPTGSSVKSSASPRALMWPEGSCSWTTSASLGCRRWLEGRAAALGQVPGVGDALGSSRGQRSPRGSWHSGTATPTPCLVWGKPPREPVQALGGKHVRPRCGTQHLRAGKDNVVPAGAAPWGQLPDAAASSPATSADPRSVPAFEAPGHHPTNCNSEG